MYEYVLYGVSLRSEWPLPYANSTDPALPLVELLDRPASFFAGASSEADRQAVESQWARYVPLPDGAEYLRWTGLFEFLISPDGRQIAGRRFPGATPEAFHTYLLGQVLSHTLIKLGFEPLHATVVEVDGQAVGFLGDTGRGKSTLAAAFLSAGARLLTDDLLVLRDDDGDFLACPGAPRLKLFPEVAESTNLAARTGATPMNPLTSKLMIPLDSAAYVSCPMPLRGLYVLGAPGASAGRRGVTIRRLPRRRAFLELVRNTYNRDVVRTDRVARQMALNTRLVMTVPVKLLSFPRRLSLLPAVRDDVLSDLARRDGARGPRRVSAPLA